MTTKAEGRTTMKSFIVKRSPKPWVVVDNTHDGRIHHFDSQQEAEAFAKAEQAKWDEEMRNWYRRMAEEDEEADRFNRGRAEHQLADRKGKTP
jgi:hypothetical protein